MMTIANFMPSVTGMEAYSHALGQVSTNVANINTTGYKSNETMFYTLLGSSPVVKGNQNGISSSKADIDGVGYYDRTAIDKPGTVTATGGNFDVAINGSGNAFFFLRDSANKPYYTRAGDFQTRTENGVTYLISKNGMKVQGFPAVAGGGFGATPENIVITNQEKIPSTPTTKAQVTANVPATGVDSSSYSITAYGPNNDGRTMNMIFTKVEGKLNTWKLSFDVDGGTVTAPDLEATFSADGKLLTPKDFNVSIAWDEDAGGGSNNIAVNIENMTQYDGSSGITDVKQDGAPSGTFVKSFIDSDGVVKATYSNGKTLNYAKLALVGFEAPNNMIPISGTVFQANKESGESHYIEDTKNLITPQALERSNTNIEEQFSKMVIIQRAYSSNAQTFTVTDEMLQTAVNIKT